MLLYDLVAKITLDTKEYEENAKRLKSGLATGAKVAAAAIAAATTAIAAFAKESVKTGMAFDKSMSQVAATMGTTVDNIQNLRDFAIEMGSKTAFSARESAEALNYMALAGYSAEQSMEALPNVLNLAAAGSIELARASDMITDAQSALGLTMAQSAKMVDQMAKTASKSNTSVEQLGDAILTVGGTAKYMSGGTEQINKVLGILADNGIKGAEAGTHLRNMLMSLSAPTDAASARLEQLGVGLFDSEGKMRDFAEVFPELNAAMSELTDEEKLQAFSDIFNTRDIASATALLNTTSERWEELGSAIEDAGGAAQKMAETQLDNLAGDITLFKSALEGAQITISDEVTPSLRELVQFGTSAIGTLSSAFKQGGLSGAMKALGTILSDGLSMVIKRLPDFVNSGVMLLSSLSEGIIQNLPLLVESALQIISTLANGLIENLPSLIPSIIDVLLQIVDTLTSPDTIVSLVNAALQLILALGQGLIEAIPRIVEKIPIIIDNLISALIDAIPMIIEAGIQLLIALVENLPAIIRGIVSAIPKIIEGIISKIDEIIPAMIDAGVQLFIALIENLPKIIIEVVKAIPQIIKALVEGFGKFFSKMGEVGLNLIKGLWEGIKNAASWLWGKVKGFFEDLIGKVKGFLGIKSPSKVFASMGDFMAQGIGVGFGKAIVGVGRQIQADIDNLVSGASRQFSISGDYNMIGAMDADDSEGGGGLGGRRVYVVQNIYSEAKTAADLMEEARWQAELAVI